ncbi:protein Aatf-like [Babylonia areolata]|uniref:protein Aatf-like n=1 Tax=Babylonia areolata TaxID=304850 RepID=UPI003FD09715
MAALMLEDYIKKLQEPVPEFRDPEDVGDETAARLAPHASEDTDDATAAVLQPSALRRRAAALWDSGGKKTSRKELYGDSDDDVNSMSEIKDEEEDEEEAEEEDEVRGKGDGEEMSDDEEDVEEAEEEVGMLDDDDDDDGSELAEESEDDDLQSGDSEEDDEDLDEDSTAGKEDEEITSAESEGEDIHIAIQDTAVDEGEKAQAVVQQLDLWDRLMEARIQLQKVLSQVNRLPTRQQSQASEHLSEAGESGDVVTEMICTLHGVLNSPSSPRKRKADVDVDELARESHESLVKTRNTTLTFWDEKTRLASKKFKSFKSYQTPVVKQVEQILSDRDRLVRRTQVIRDSDAPDVCDNPEEIFDDNDFYQRLLKNLIESKASEESSMSASASQWLEVQRLRGRKKKKKDVDTRASKGRKLRYNIHSKLVNFMVPRDESTWSEDARNELFKNLFKMPSHPEV